MGSGIQTQGIGFAVSIPGEVVMDPYGFNVESVCQHVRTLLASA